MLRPDTYAFTVLLAVLTAIGPLSVDLYLPSLPEIGRVFGVGTAEVQLTLSAYLIGFAVGQIVYGPVSDLYGRKRVLLAALVLFCLATLVCAFAPSIEALIVARTVQALGGAGAVVLARTVVRDLYSGPRAGRELSLMGMIMGIAPVIAPSIGGLLQTAFGWRACFLFIFAAAVVTLAAVWWLLPETLPYKPQDRVDFAALLRPYRIVARHGGFMAHVALVSTSFCGLFAFISGAPFVLQNFLGLTPLEFAVAFAVAALGNIVGTMIAAKLVMRAGLDRTLGLGALTLAAGGLALVATTALVPASAAGFVLPVTVYMAGFGILMPMALAGAMHPFPGQAGTASSLLGFTQQGTAAVAGAVVGHLLGATAWPLVVIEALGGVLAFVIWASTRRVRALPPAKPNV